MKTSETWKLIHAERAALADTWESMDVAQWEVDSWCEGWSVHMTAGHVVAAAEQTFPNFYKELAAAGFRFNEFAERGAKRFAATPPDELIARLRRRTTTTNHPPAPVVAMLGEIVVHGQDIRRPLGLTYRSSEAALVAVAENYRRSNLLIGSKRRIAGLELVATDSSWRCGAGPEVRGPLASLILAMAGRVGALEDLAGDGLATLGERQPSATA